jgi:hypothetical protein
MTGPADSIPTESGALVAVRDLEHALEAKQAGAVDAEARLERAREDAAAILAAARERAARQAERRRTALLAEVDAEVRRIEVEAEAAAGRLRAGASEVEDAFVDAALALVLPDRAEEEPCSSR